MRARIGTNPNAKIPNNILESEKIKGTVHLGIGDNLHMSGKVSSDIHQDFIIPNARATETYKSKI